MVKTRRGRLLIVHSFWVLPHKFCETVYVLNFAIFQKLGFIVVRQRNILDALFELR